MNFKKIIRKITFLFSPRDWYPLQKGLIIDCRYEIVQLLGVGGYSYAYLVKDSVTNQEYTLKQIKRHIRLLYKKEKFLKEGRLLDRLDEPHVFPVPKKSFIWNKQIYILLPYVKGIAIDRLVFEKGKMYTELEALILFKKAIEKVIILHDVAIFHNDLRLPNFLIDDNEVNLIDFGLAEIIEPVSQEALNYELFHLGHFLLFLLYSSYEITPGQKERSWEEELYISNQTHQLLRKLLLLDEPFQNIHEVYFFLMHHDIQPTLRYD